MPAATDRPAPASPAAGLPATPDDLLRAAGHHAVGILLIVGGAIAAAGTDDDPQRALWYLNITVAGLALAGVANGVLIARMRRHLQTRRDDVLARSRAVTEARVARAPVDTTVSPTNDGHHLGDGDRRRVPGSSRFHRADCAFVAGRPTDAVDATDDLVPCEICEP